MKICSGESLSERTKSVTGGEKKKAILLTKSVFLLKHSTPGDLKGGCKTLWFASSQRAKDSLLVQLILPRV